MSDAVGKDSIWPTAVQAAGGHEAPVLTHEDWVGLDALREHFAHGLRPAPMASWYGKRIGSVAGQAANNAAVVCLGIERVELISAGLGREAEERLTEEVRLRLSDTLRLRDVVAGPSYVEIGMMGRGLFTVFVAWVSGEAEVRAIGACLRERMTEAFFVMGNAVHLPVKVGVSVSVGAASGEDLFRDAEAALYAARAEEAEPCVLFDAAIRREMVTRVELERDIWAGIGRGEFRVVYQPIVCLATAEVTGFEALLRWDHPSRGLVAPGAFIPVAEETGLIVDLGRLALEEACRELARLDGEFGDQAEGRRFTMSVNVSKRQLMGHRFIGTTEGVLAASGIEARRLHLEVTESVVMQHAERVTPMLGALRALGVAISMDDFGVGQSSLSCLQQFPLDYLKIDRAFMAGAAVSRRHAAVVRSVLALARDLGLRVVAEGIESMEQVALLQTMDCDYAQGYLFAPPLGADELRTFLRNRVKAIGAIGDGSAAAPAGDVEAA